MNELHFIKDFSIPSDVKVISFDVFDTLLLRPFERPEDIFNFISPLVEEKLGKKLKFTYYRKKAEKDTRKKSIQEEVTLNEIYENFNSIPTALKEEIKNLEIEAELKFCFPRKSGLALYEMAKKNGLKIVATSDIYLEKPLLTKLLKKNGFEFDEVFSSSSLRKKKSTGSIFPEIVNILKVKPNEILQVGDNMHSDVIMAQKAGLHAFHLPLLRGELHKNILYKKIFKRIGKKCILTSMTAGMISQKLEEEKQNTTSLLSNNLYNLGFNVFGSMIFAYTIWLFNELKKHNIKKIFFVARDGYIMKKVFEILFKERDIEVHYLEISRRSLMSLSVSDVNNVKGFFDFKIKKHKFDFKIKNTTISIKNYIINKLECDPEKIIPHLEEIGFKSIDDIMFRKDIPSVVKYYEEELYEKLKVEKHNLLIYLKNSGVLDGKVALCDIGYGANTQSKLQELSSKENIFGYYFLTNNHAKRVKNSYGFLYNNASKMQFNSFLSHASRLLEGILFGAPSGSVINYDHNGKPNYITLTQPEVETFERQKLVWEGILDFNRLIKKHFKDDVENIRYNKNIVSKMFFQFLLTPQVEDAKMLNNLVFENKFSTGGYRFIIEDGLWQAGSIASQKPKLYKTLTPFFKLWLYYKNIIDKINL